MRSRPTSALVVPLLALAAVALTGCAGGDDAPDAAASPAATRDGGAGVTPEGVASDDAPAGGGDFCADYEAAGGTLATPGPFQVGMTREMTVADLAPRVAVFDGVTPPDEIATQWQTLQGLYTEALTTAEGTAEGAVVADPRVFDLLKELKEPAADVRDYLDASC